MRSSGGGFPWMESLFLGVGMLFLLDFWLYSSWDEEFAVRGGEYNWKMNY